MNNYDQLPNPPEALDTSTLMIRLVQSIGFRYQLATRGLTESDAEFRPVTGSMNMLELLDHMYRLMGWLTLIFGADYKYKKGLNNYQEYISESLIACQKLEESLSGKTTAELESTTVYLKRTDTTFSFWYIINGPLTDILTHIGQVNSWRRIAGNPCPRISPFTGEGY